MCTTYFDVDIVSSWVEKVAEESLDRFVIHVSADHNELAAVGLVFPSVPVMEINWLVYSRGLNRLKQETRR